jgi:AmmeMemoRadiSam system protein A
MHAPDRQDLTGTELLRLARSSIEYGLVNRKPLPVDCEDLPQALTKPGATFTTVRCDGELRGCRGSIEAALPLAQDVARSAFQAAFHDPRFDPVGEHELCALRLEVSVLSPLENVRATDEADLLNRLTPGTDGLVIVVNEIRATFLPDVWTTLPEPRQFIAALKAKCGLPGDYWSEHVEFQRYQTTSYEEPM